MQSGYLCRLLVKLGLDLRRHFFVLKLLRVSMIPHIFLEPELLHLFDNDEERDNLSIKLIEVIQTVIRAECSVLTKNKTKDPYGLKEIMPSAMDDLCEKMTPKLNTITQSYINSSAYSNKITAEVYLNHSKLSVYLSPKYYTGFSSSIH